MDMLDIEMQCAYLLRGKFGGKDAADFKHRSVCILSVTLELRNQMFTIAFGLSSVESLALFHCVWLPSLPASV